MIASMTAYGRSAISEDWGQAIWELRSVNHRYLDLSFKLPENFREWETSWRNIAANVLHRGKVECHLTFIPSQNIAPNLHINFALVNQLISSCQRLADNTGINPKMDAMELLRWPDVLITKGHDISYLKEPVTALFTLALEDLIQSRKREGGQLCQILKSKLHQVLEQVVIVKEKLPLCLKAQKQKLIQKVAEIRVSLDPQRLEQELVLYAQRTDVEEEVERLVTHTKEVLRALDDKGAMGRRLDFLMQEMNREANTLAAKAPDNTVTQAAIELKVLIEQMREQIQNVE